MKKGKDKEKFPSQYLMQVIEGLLFIYGDDGLSFNELATAMPNEKISVIKKAVDLLEEKYAKDASTALSIQKYGEKKLRLQTKRDIYDPLSKLVKWQSSGKLTSSAIEVLAVIAYRGPIAKTEIDELRQLDSSYQISRLRERSLIRVVGKNSNRANLYVITDNFFKLFSLKDGLKELPQIDINQLKLKEDKNNISKDLFDKNFE